MAPSVIGQRNVVGHTMAPQLEDGPDSDTDADTATGAGAAAESPTPTSRQHRDTIPPILHPAPAGGGTVVAPPHTLPPTGRGAGATTPTSPGTMGFPTAPNRGTIPATRGTGTLPPGVPAPASDND